jgi:hypothetical protein
MRNWMVGVLLIGALQGWGVTRYVSVSGGSDDNAPYTSMSTPAQTIQAAVDVASKGDLILVASGTYDTGGATTPGGSSFNRVMIDQDITVRSVYPLGAVISGGTKVSAVRCAFLKAGRLENFVLQNGKTGVSGDSHLDRSGGGGNLYGGSGVVSGCRFETCTASYFGGGAYGGDLIDCQFYNCSSTYGGGSAYADLSNCIVSSNSASRGGGCYYGSGDECLIAENSASYAGGGLYEGSFEHCRVRRNTSVDFGGGSYGSDLEACQVSGNSSYNGGGGYYGELVGCLLRGNRAGGVTGGAAVNAALSTCVVMENSSGCSDSDLYFCTVALNDGAGVLNGTVENCIVVDNDAYNVTNATVLNVCSPDVSHGVSGCITNAPLFEGMSLRLRSDSPCIDKGVLGSVARLIDYDGTPRPLDGDGLGSPAGGWDIGAFEYCSEEGDKDGDGLSDYDETHVYYTDPGNSDTDGDGRADGDEVTDGFCPAFDEAGAIAMGEDNVIDDPESYGLFSEESVRDARLGNLEMHSADGLLQLVLFPRDEDDEGELFTWPISTPEEVRFFRVGAE